MLSASFSTSFSRSLHARNQGLAGKSAKRRTVGIDETFWLPAPA
jgi:hypothetical protein